MNIKTVLLISSLLCVFYSCAEKKEIIKKTIRPVYVQTINNPNSLRMRSFTGVIRPTTEVTLSFRVSGTITELPISAGHHLSKGDLVGKLDETEYILEVEKMEASLEQALSQMKKAKADYDRTRLLYEAANVSKSILDRDLSLFTSSKAQQQAAETALNIAKKHLEYCTLKSPVSGDILEVPVNIYQTVQAGQVIAKLTSGSSLEMEIGVPEALINQIYISDLVTLTFDAFPQIEWHAKVKEVGVTTTESSTYPVRLTILDNDERLRAGMSGEASLGFQTTMSLIRVPTESVVSTADNKKYVWIYQPDNKTVTRRQVVIGDLTSKGIEIKEGLMPGDIIVIKGVHNIDEGMEVRIVAD